MKPLIIIGTHKTPEVSFDDSTGKLFIGGRSYSSDAFDFYKPITSWINEYLLNPKDPTILEINIEYFHSVSLKYLTTIIKKIEHLPGVKISWLHACVDEEDESLELGKAIERNSKIRFDFIEVPEAI